MGSLIDVSDIMSDPEFVQSITLIKRTACIDSFGQNNLTESAKCTVGSVQPISGKALQRLPEALRVANVQSFWLREKIVIDSSSKYPDVLVKNGKRFIVQVVFDWSDWGAGWTEGTCVAERPAG
jgi:hypothetical protein